MGRPTRRINKTVNIKSSALCDRFSLPSPPRPPGFFDQWLKDRLNETTLMPASWDFDNTAQLNQKYRFNFLTQ